MIRQLSRPRRFFVCPYVSFKSPQMQHVSLCSLGMTPQQVIGGLVSKSEAWTESCVGSLASATKQLAPQTPTLIQLIVTLRAEWEQSNLRLTHAFVSLLQRYMFKLISLCGHIATYTGFLCQKRAVVEAKRIRLIFWRVFPFYCFFAVHPTSNFENVQTYCTIVVAGNSLKISQSECCNLPTHEMLVHIRFFFYP